ncbi:ABC transporter permease [Lysinibacillus pakistanensis]|uniref:ABC transporter permease n=1 Tax=Lysinibacillus pakistanensis TaxID=759811 RepID=A0AAX3X568_9BACI|nr:ABC transporter permease [Lysinibacillus pakistanensis]MDM5233736.1 ABC transporter permease [Lysinibacillus pakistanensis]WHY49173.1 ABC transporter permease [Lysinibacillus pakistanensis]WHY54183.1 ABC transporter permease [Lysinibacillus pakistanensis]
MKQAIQKGRSIIFIAFLLFIWELIVRLADIPHWLLPSPSAILTEGIRSFETFMPHAFATVQLALLGLTIGICCGLAVAVLLHRFSFIRELFYPILIMSQNVPILVLAPLLIIWFGFGLLPKLIIICLVCFFPIVIAAMDGFRQTSPELKHYFEMIGATKAQTFWKLEWPFAYPSIFSGIKIAATYSVMGAVIAEWLGAKKGIGVYMTLAQSSFRTDRVFVAILAIICLSLVLFSAIRLLEKIIVKGRGFHAKRSKY